MCRDDFITINWENIMSGMEYNFLKYDLSKISHLGASYDTCSVMHYGAYAFSKVSHINYDFKGILSRDEFKGFLL
jgi:hypothetical protein